MLDIEKIRREIDDNIRLPKDEDGESQYMDDYLVEAMKLAKKVPFPDKTEYAKEHPEHLLEALQEISGPGVSVGKLLDEMVFMQLM